MTGRPLEWRWNRPPDASGNGQRCCNLCRTGIVVNTEHVTPDLILCLNCGATAPADTKPTPLTEEKSRMSGSARTALVTVEVTFRMTDTATEGEMIDAAICAVRKARPTLKSPGGTAQSGGIRASITTKATGGHL